MCNFENGSIFNYVLNYKQTHMLFFLKSEKDHVTIPVR